MTLEQKRDTWHVDVARPRWPPSVVHSQMVWEGAEHFPLENSLDTCKNQWTWGISMGQRWEGGPRGREISVLMADSCCTVETNTTLQSDMDMGVQQKPGWTSDHRSDETKDVSVGLRAEHHQGDKIVHLCKISAYHPPTFRSTPKKKWRDPLKRLK